MHTLASASAGLFCGGIWESSVSAPQVKYRLPQSRLPAQPTRFSKPQAGLFTTQSRLCGAHSRFFPSCPRLFVRDSRLFLPSPRFFIASPRLFPPRSRFFIARSRLFVTNNLDCAPQYLQKTPDLTVFHHFSAFNPFFPGFWHFPAHFPGGCPAGQINNTTNRQIKKTKI